ncbi:hypothetical protein GGQ68_002316 [Sagittula marina]|uniref:Uncharacterized protein n=1 Tax=Sagittula marina TaxID=943940 RepID=A0A7W6DTW1_9RHOB|nr:hypothetical protein [Sagittula marina]MBB3985978.1 hypothetical protein [Sagittula marina]
MTELNIEKFREEWQDEEWQELLKHLASQPDASEHTINELQGMWDCDRGYAIECARSLEEYGFGQFIVGRRGGKTRFHWWYSSTMVAKAGMGDDDAAEQLQRGVDENFRKTVWKWSEIRDRLAEEANLDPSEIILDINIGDAKENFAKLHGLDTSEVSIRVGG